MEEVASMKNTMQYIQLFLTHKGDHLWKTCFANSKDIYIHHGSRKKINLLHRRVTFLLTFEFLDLRLTGIFLSTAIASPPTSEMNIERVEDNESSRRSCLNHTVAQSKIALLIAGRY